MSDQLISEKVHVPQVLTNKATVPSVDDIEYVEVSMSVKDADTVEVAMSVFVEVPVSSSINVDAGRLKGKKKKVVHKIHTEDWISESLERSLSEKSGRNQSSPSFRFITLSSDNVQDLENRRFRNESIGNMIWPIFESYRMDSIVHAYRGIILGMQKEHRTDMAISLAGNFANRITLVMALANRPMNPMLWNNIMAAFPPSIINIAVTITNPEVFGDAVDSIDNAMIKMKRFMDYTEKNYSSKVHSCVILPNRNKDAVMIDVPEYGCQALPSSVYSLCRNTSKDDFMLFRMRKAVKLPNGKEIQLPLVDVTLEYRPYREMDTQMAPLGRGRVHVPKLSCLKEHFDRLLTDQDVVQSPMKLARCIRAADIINGVFSMAF